MPGQPEEHGSSSSCAICGAVATASGLCETCAIEFARKKTGAEAGTASASEVKKPAPPDDKPAPSAQKRIISGLILLVIAVGAGLLLELDKKNETSTLERPGVAVSAYWEPRLDRATSPDPANDPEPLRETMRNAAQAYRLTISQNEKGSLPGIEARLAVLLAELGDREGLASVSAQCDGLSFALGSTLATAYPEVATKFPRSEVYDASALDQLSGLMPYARWTNDRLEWRWALRNEDSPRAEAAAERIQQRRRALLGGDRRRERRESTILFVGLAALALLALSRKRSQQANAFHRPPWKFLDAFLIACGGFAIHRAMTMISAGVPAGFRGWIQIISLIPALIIVWLFILRPAGLRFRDAFALRIRGIPWGRALLWLPGLLALEMATGRVLDVLPLQSLWSNAWLDPMYWGEGFPLALDLLGLCVVTPLFREWLHRGFLFRTLSLRWGSWTGAVLSSFLCAASLGGDCYGFVYLFCTSLIACLGFAATGSLWIPILYGVVSTTHGAVFYWMSWRP